MTEAEAYREIERRMRPRLARWVSFRRDPRYPDAVTSSTFSGEVSNPNRLPTSPQERWLLRHADDIRLSIAIEEGFRWMTERQRRVVFFRVVQGMTWGSIRHRMNLTGYELQRERREAWQRLSEQFGEPLDLFLD